MGWLWETYQQSSSRRADAAQDAISASLAQRVVWLEEVVAQQSEMLGYLIQQLEVRFGRTSTATSGSGSAQRSSIRLGLHPVDVVLRRRTAHSSSNCLARRMASRRPLTHSLR